MDFLSLWHSSQHQPESENSSNKKVDDCSEESAKVDMFWKEEKYQWENSSCCKVVKRINV